MKIKWKLWQLKFKKICNNFRLLKTEKPVKSFKDKSFNSKSVLRKEKTSISEQTETQKVWSFTWKRR